MIFSQSIHQIQLSGFYDAMDGFRTDLLFTGGAGMFLQYHDVLKPVYLYATLAMMMDNPPDLPIDIIAQMSPFAVAEWYRKRRYINPLKSIDFNKVYDTDSLDDFLELYLSTDGSIYHIAPMLNIESMLYVYTKQKMNIPIYVYSEKEEKFIPEDIERCYPGIKINYVYGDFDKAITDCMDNFTYIFSDIRLVEKLFEHSADLCAHVLLCREYRYNYTDNCRTPKIDMEKLARVSPLIHLGYTQSITLTDLAQAISNTFRTISEEG